MIWNIGKHQIDCILDVRRTNIDTPSNIHRYLETVLPSHDREKEEEKPPSLSRPTPSLLSLCGLKCDGVLGNGARVVLQNLAGSLAQKS